MTYQEARHIVEASTRFEVQGGHVWLREVRWLRAVQRLRSEEATPAVPLLESASAALTVGVRRPPLHPAHLERRAAPTT